MHNGALILVGTLSVTAIQIVIIVHCLVLLIYCLFVCSFFSYNSTELNKCKAFMFLKSSGYLKNSGASVGVVLFSLINHRHLLTHENKKLFLIEGRGEGEEGSKERRVSEKERNSHLKLTRIAAKMNEGRQMGNSLKYTDILCTILGILQPFLYLLSVSKDLVLYSW